MRTPGGAGRVRGLAGAGCVLVVAAAVAVTACGWRNGAVEEPEMETLRRRVAEARATVEERPAPGTDLSGSGVADAELVVRLRTPLLLRVVESVAALYLDEVVLDLRPDVTVRESEEVQVDLGPLRVTAGEWVLRVRIEEILARLQAGQPQVAVTHAGELAVDLPVDVADGSGRASLDFTWDARSVAAAVCRDFRVRETFAATVAARTYLLSGHFDLRLLDGVLSITPRFPQSLEVRPEPTAESWRRVREILESQDRIFRCGLALDPDGLEAELRRLLRVGFRFRLPDDVLRTVRLPARVGGDVAVAGRRFAATADTAGVRLGPDWLWYGIDLSLAPDGAEDPPISPRPE